MIAVRYNEDNKKRETKNNRNSTEKVKMTKRVSETKNEKPI